MGVSLKPSEAVESSGFLDDEDVKVIDSRFTMFDYGGKAQAVPALMWQIDRMDGSEPVNQYWSMGKATDWAPSDDGREINPIGNAKVLSLNSNGMLLLTSLINSGVSEGKIDDDISIFNGLECHVNRVAAPVRKGLSGQKEGQTILTVTKIIKAPWDAAPAKSKGKGGGKAKAAAKATTATATAASDIDAIATEFLLNVLSNEATMKDYPDGIPKAKLAPEAFSAFPATDPNRSAVVRKVFLDEFLNNGPWVYKEGKVSLG